MTLVASRPDAGPTDNGRSHVAELWWLRAATLVATLHALDDAVLHRQPGVPPTQHLPALAVLSLVAVAGLLAFSRCRSGVRAVLALTFGAFATTDGATHVMHLFVDEPAATRGVHARRRRGPVWS